ncbi:Adenine DNA glycosylase [Candidatus Entotheonellaceae bacterium PAL068K]
MSNIEERAAFFRRQIIAWGACHGRNFPWRNTTASYRLLIAELMLRRTRAEQVKPIYETFVHRFPTLQTLASASEDEVKKLLLPLGLAWRVPAFRQMAWRVVDDYAGQIPRDRKALLSLPGVGEYVADAVRCFAYNEPVAILDTNTIRVAGRYSGFPVHAESRRRAPVKRAVARLVDPEAPRAGNLALLDFAATVCRARRPLCASCPVEAGCAWQHPELSTREA